MSAKKRKVVAKISQDGTVVKNPTTDTKKRKVVAKVNLDNSITKYNNSNLSIPHAQQYNLDGSKKIAPTVSITTNNIAKQGATNILNNTLQQDLKNKTFEAATGQNKQQINLAGDSTLSKTEKQKLREKTAEEKKKINANLPQMVSADSVKNKGDDLVNDLSKKTGYSEQEITDFINDYNNGKWDSTQAKYKNASYKFKEAGTEVYLAAKEYDKYKPTLNKQLSPLENAAQSSANALIETGKGIVDFSEGVLDAGIQLGSSKYNPMMWITTGQTPWSEDQSKLNSYQNIAKEIVGKDASQNFIDNELGYGKTLSDGRTMQETLDEGALIKSDNLGGQVFRNIGAQLPGLMTGSEAGSLASMGISTFGSGVEQAYNQGATRGEATGYGLLNSGIEVATEKMFSGVGGVLGKGEIDDAIINGINKNIKNQLAQKLTSFGIKSLGEGTEEFIGDLMQPLAQKLTYASEEDLMKLYKDQNYLEDFISGVLSAAIMQGSTMPINNQSQIQIKNQVKEIVNKDNANQIFNDILKNNKNLSEWEVANIVNNALKETNQKPVDFSKNVVQNETTQETNPNTPQISQEIGQNQELSDETTNNSQTVEAPQNDLNKYNNIIDVEKKQIAPIDFDLQVESALNDNQSKGNIYISKQTDSKIINIIKKLTGIDVTNRKHVLSKDYIRHLFKHSDETNPGQISITKEDIKKIPDIVSNPDNIVRGSDTLDASRKNKIPSIRYIKTDNTGKMYVVEAIPEKGNLQIKTMWKEPTKLIHSNNALHHTSETANSSNSSTLTDNNVTTKTQKSQVAPASSQYSMHQKTENDTKAPIIRENNEINESIKDDVIEVSSKDLKTKTKKETTTEDDKVANILKERPVTEEEKDNRLKKLLTVKILDKGYYVDKLARKIKNRELSSKYDYMLSANGVAQQIIGNNKFNPKTQEYKGKGLYKIFEPIENSGKLDDFSQYIYHKHNISRMNLNSLYSEDNKPVFSSNVTAEDSQKIVDKYEKNNPEFKEWAKEVYDYNNFLLDILVDYEVISKEDKAYYNKKYPYYVPTIRVSDKTKVNLEMIGKKASINIPIKKAKGGNGDIIPLKEAMSLRTMQTLNSALKNNFGNELFDSIETEAINEKMDIDEVLNEETDTDEIITKYTKDSPATLTIYKKGEKITFNIPDEIYDALEPSNIKKFKWLNNISKFRRGLITEYNPAFFITNPIKDVQDGIINSKYPSKFAKNIAEAGKQIKEKGRLYQLYLANGGSYETYFNYSDGYNKGPKTRMKYSPMKILDSISSLNEKIEMTPRLAEFISSLEGGDTIETAMYNAQEITTNFKRGGVWTKVADANGATFLNAGVQGGLKQIRNIQEAKTNGIKGMTNLAVKFTIAGLTPYILSELIWGDDDDYEELSEYIKNNYYILWKYGDGKFVKIPRGRVTSVIQNLFGQILDTRKGEKIDIKEFIDLLNNQIAPNDPTESNIFSPIINVLENKTWYGTDLVSQRLSDLPSSEQYDESTDSISIWLGKMTGISPVKINYLLDQYSSSIGDIILPFLTLEAENDSNSIVGNLLSPIKSKFATDSVMKSKYPSEFFELDEKLTKKANSSNASDEDILRSKYVNSKQYQLNQLYAEKRVIQNDKNLTDTEKYKQVRKKQEEINQLAKEVIETYKDVNINGSTATVNDLKYKKDKNGKWVKQRS